MELIKKVSWMVHLDKAGEKELFLYKVEEEDNRECYRYHNTEYKIDAALQVNKKKDVQAVSLKLEIENHPFWENYNLDKNAPIILKLKLREKPKAMLAHYMFNDWWTRPAFPKNLEGIPDRTQSLLMQYEKEVWYLLPMAGDSYKTIIRGGQEDTLHLEMTAYAGGIREVKEISQRSNWENQFRKTVAVNL